MLPAPVTLACIAVFPQEPALPRTCTRLTLCLPYPPRRGVSAKIVDVNCGTYATFATTADGHVFTFGLNNYGQLALPGAHGRGIAAPATAGECMHVAQRLLAPLQPLSRPERTRLSRFLFLPEPCPALFLLNVPLPFPFPPFQAWPSCMPPPSSRRCRARTWPSSAADSTTRWRSHTQVRCAQVLGWAAWGLQQQVHQLGWAAAGWAAAG